MSLYCITLFYSYTQTYYDNVSQSTYLQKLAVLPLLNVKSLVYLNKSCTNTFCRRGYWLRENDSSVYFSRITIPAFHVSKAKHMISTVNQITNFPITCERGNSNRIRLPQRVVDSCHVLQSLIFMMLGHMGEAHRDGLPVQFMILFDFDISAWMLQFYIQMINWSSHSLFTNVHKKM